MAVTNSGPSHLGEQSRTVAAPRRPAQSAAPGRSVLDPLQGDGHALAAGDAQGGQAAPGPLGLELGGDGGGWPTWRTLRAPGMPIGWQRAMAPPLTLVRSQSNLSSRSQARTWAAN